MPAQVPPDPSSDPSGTARVVAWPPALRAVAAVLQGLTFAFLLDAAWLLSLDLADGSDRAPPIAVVVIVGVFAAPPRLLLAVLRAAFAATVTFGADTVQVAQHRVRFEVPRASIASAQRWLLPLPGPGISLILASGRRFGRALETDAPASRFGPAPAEPTRAAAASAAFAEARAQWHRRSLAAFALKYVAFPLLPTGIMFRAHQHITYGGSFGQWQMYGPAAYLRSFAEYLIGTAAHLIVIAAVLRAGLELLTLAGTWIAPRRATLFRRAAELGCRWLYYAGIPALIGLSFLL